MCFLPCASRQGRPFWPPAGDHEGRPYGAFAPIRKDWEARMAYHILLVDDAPELRRMVGELLEGAGYAVTLAADCAQARRAWTESQPDAALLDVMLPDGDGFSLLEELRRVGNGVPVLFLSARDEDEARLRGLGLGADDYITKPFNPIEVIARVKSQLRRYTSLGGKQGGGEANPALLTNGGIALDDGAKSVTVDGEGVSLTPIEYNILLLLMKNPGRVFSTSQIYELVWNDPSLGSENTVAVHIRHLREKLEIDPANPRYIKVVWGLGYKMEKV